MKNFVQPGKTVTVTAPYDVASGAGLLVGSLFGVAAAAAASGAAVEASTEGVFDLNKLSTDTIDAGQLVYWDPSNKRVTETATDNHLIGVALAAAGNGATTVRVRLNGAFVGVTPAAPG